MSSDETFGPYDILAPEGAEGPVRHFLARRRSDASMARACRLRRLDLRQVDDAEIQYRLLDEARLVIGLDHPGVVATLDYGVIDDELYLEEELVDGTDLGAMLRRHGALEPGVTLVIASRLAEVLTYAHGLRDRAGRPLNLVHRSLMPRHVHITGHGETKLAGFGMARYSGRLVRTSLGVILEHIRYTSPEAIRGEPLDSRSDLFGLGILMYEMLAGRTPYDPRDFAHARQLYSEGTHPSVGELVQGLDPAFTALVEQLLRRDPADRVASAQEVWERCWTLRRTAGSPRDESRLRQLVHQVLDTGGSSDDESQTIDDC
jgi:serine/threonine-protein kinase